MLVRPKVLHYAARSCTLALSSVTLSKRNATKTTKIFSELPSVFLRPDGTTASPLGEWRAGPERTSSHMKLVVDFNVQRCFVISVRRLASQGTKQRGYSMRRAGDDCSFK
jgi:hypothetical protein